MQHFVFQLPQPNLQAKVQHHGEAGEQLRADHVPDHQELGEGATRATSPASQQTRSERQTGGSSRTVSKLEDNQPRFSHRLFGSKIREQNDNYEHFKRSILLSIEPHDRRKGK